MIAIIIAVNVLENQNKIFSNYYLTHFLVDYLSTKIGGKSIFFEREFELSNLSNRLLTALFPIASFETA